MDIMGAIETTDNCCEQVADIRAEINAVGMAAEATAAANAAVVAKTNADDTFRLHDNIRNATDAVLTSSTLTQAQVASAAAQTAAQTSSVLTAISATAMRQLQDKLDELRLERSKLETDVSFGNQFSLIQSQLNHLEQAQRTTNQAINFGTGTIGAQSATQNQVRS